MTWLKMDHATPEKPEVLAITVRMGWDDPDLTVGKLFRLWRWFDQQTTDGNALSVSAALLDRIVGVSGFCDAVHSVGWLCINPDGVSLPNFDRHNGQTAKDRANTAKRVAKHTAKRSSNAQANGASVSPGVSAPLPREEKNREEKKHPPAPKGEGVSDSFARFWESWPTSSRKAAKDQCEAKWRSKGCEQIAETVLSALDTFKASDDWQREAGRFIPAPLVWLNQARWEAAGAAPSFNTEGFI